MWTQYRLRKDQQFGIIKSFLQHHMLDNSGFFGISRPLSFKDSRIGNFNCLFTFNFSKLQDNSVKFGILDSQQNYQFSSVPACKDILQILGEKEKDLKVWIEEYSDKQQLIQSKLRNQLTTNEKRQIFCLYKQIQFIKRPFNETTIIIIFWIVQFYKEILEKDSTAKDVWLHLTYEVLNNVIGLCNSKNTQVQNMKQRIEQYFSELSIYLKDFTDNIQTKVSFSNQFFRGFSKNNQPSSTPHRKETDRNEEQQSQILANETVRLSSFNENEPFDPIPQFFQQQNSSEDQSCSNSPNSQQPSMEDLYRLWHHSEGESWKPRYVKVEDHKAE